MIIGHVYQLMLTSRMKGIWGNANATLTYKGSVIERADSLRYVIINSTTV